jgi:hypothetical protein
MHVSKTNKKYLNFLQDFHNHCNSNIQFAARDLIKDHKVTTTVTNIMAHGGLIKVSGRGRTTEYTWNSKAPDIRMVMELRKRMTEYHKKYLTERNKPTPVTQKKAVVVASSEPVRRRRTKVVEQQPKTRSINILWGAFKITY